MNYLVVGDVHGCYNEFMALLDKAGKKNYKLVLVGDYLDKGPQQHEVIDYIHSNLDDIIVVHGNHEYWQIGYWDGKWDVEQNIKEGYFTCYNLADEYKQKVRDIWSKSVPYFRGPNFIVTHAPCHCKYLEKEDTFSLKQVRNYRHTNKTNEEIMEFISSLPANNCWPFHVFGHIALSRIYRRANLIGIDTGCVDGHFLSAVKFVEGCKPFLLKVPSNQPKKDVITISEERVYCLDNEDPVLRRKVLKIAERGINFISGTMSPADKVDNELESIRWAVQYYSDMGSSIVVQKKKMGSRAQVYLFNDPEQCYIVTRNGYRMDKLELKSEYERLIQRFKDEFDAGLKLRILDCELMPWRVLGNTLIDKSFYGYWEMASQEESLCLEKNFPSADFIKTHFNPEFCTLSKEEFIKQYKHHVFAYNKYGRELVKLQLDSNKHLEQLDTFKKQCDLYGQDGEMYIYPFAILKDVWPDKEYVHETTSNYLMFNKVNDDDIYKFDTLDIDKTTQEVQTLFDSLVELNEEGIVIKPEFPDRNYAPYLKVRNKNYLHIIYGYDFLEESKYKKLINRKSIRKKLRQSISEFNLGLKMLSQPYEQLQDPSYYSVVLAFLKEDSSNVDPRL